MRNRLSCGWVGGREGVVSREVGGVGNCEESML